MELVVMGLSHKTAPVALRERFAVSDEALGSAAERVRRVEGCRESFVVSTCNRVEVYATFDAGLPSSDALTDVLAAVGGAARAQVVPHVYVHAGSAAIRHLFRVASSLDSLVVGEPQILGQLKSAFEACRLAGQTGPVLGRALDRAIGVARRVRSETGIGRNSVSVSSVAVDLARQIFGDFGTCTVLLVGAGKMGELAARHFKTQGARELLVANRSFDRARAVAEALGGHPRGLDELEGLLTQADIVVTSTGAPGYLVTQPAMKRIVRARKYRPIFFIDIAVPRNVEPTITALENAYVYDVDDLSGIANENRAERRREAEAAERLVSDEAGRFLRDLAGQAVAPTLQALRRKADEIRNAELERALRKLGPVDEKQRKAIEMLADGVANKLLHGVFTALKDAARDERADQMDATIRQVFRLDDEDPRT
jgi:glutamyl-tRNA reductase